MCGKIEYLEKYSVASSPSRDYYGIKVLREEVILYLWRISHGPHITPIVRCANFLEFPHDKTLQDDIGRGFGERLLEHVRSIADRKKKTLLTLPKSLLTRLSTYITYADIVNLSSLSYVAREIFNDNSLWEALYKRYKIGRVTPGEKDYGMAHGWKQLVKEQHAQSLIDDKQVVRPMLKQGTLKWQRETKTTNRTTRATPQTSSSTINMGSKKPLEVTKKSLGSNVVRKPLDVRITNSTMTLRHGKNQIAEKRPTKGKSPRLASQRTAKASKEQCLPLKSESKRDRDRISLDNAKSTESKTLLRTISLQKPSCNAERKNAAAACRSTENKCKSASIKSSASRSSVSGKHENGSGRFILNDRDRARGQTSARPKARRVGPSKSTILSTDKALFNGASGIKNDTFDLSSLIEASIKNIRSPRSIFDYDFSCLDQLTPGAGDSKVNCESPSKAETLKGRKMTRPSVALDRLSEKSEPATAKSTDSMASDAKLEKRDAPHLSAKYVNAQLEKMKSSLATDFSAVGSQGERMVDRFGDVLDKFAASTADEFEARITASGRPFVDQLNSSKFSGSAALSRRPTNVRRNYPTSLNRFKEIGGFRGNQEGRKEQFSGRK